MTNNQKIFNKLIGKSKISEVLPLLKTVAKEHGLSLNRVDDFKKARVLLVSRYNIIKIN